MKKKIPLTREGKEKLESELRNYIDVLQPENLIELEAARAQGDLKENADYDAARNRQASIDAKIKEIQDILNNCEIIEETVSDTVKLGSTVVIKDLSDNKEYTYTIVGSVEADPLGGKISNECALAAALIGNKVGSQITVKVRVPYDVIIVSISA